MQTPTVVLAEGKYLVSCCETTKMKVLVSVWCPIAIFAPKKTCAQVIQHDAEEDYHNDKTDDNEYNNIEYQYQNQQQFSASRNVARRNARRDYSE